MLGLSLVSGLSLVASDCLAAPARTQSRYKINFSGRLAYHAFEPRDLASHRYTLEVEQFHRFSSNWSITASGRAVAEAAYAANPDRYTATALRDEASELDLRDFFLQFQAPGVRMRAGNQQIVWGETFGSFFADLVNPKDLRQYGIGEFESVRIPTPMVSMKFYGGTSGIEFIYVPYPRFDRYPTVGSDFSSYSSVFPDTSISVNDPSTLSLSSSRGEVGARASVQAGGMDLSFLYFSYLDRRPSYAATVTSLSPLGVTLDATHSRISTAGLTAAVDVAGLVLRLEALHTWNRRFDLLSGSSLQSRIANEDVYAIEGDYGAIQNWRFGLQWSGARVQGGTGGFIFPKKDALGARITHDFAPERSVEILTSWIPSDGGTLWQLGYKHPVSNMLEARLGADLFLGGSSTLYGVFHSASRGYLELRAYLGE